MVARVFIEGDEGHAKIFEVQIKNDKGETIIFYFEVYGPGGELKNCFCTEGEAKNKAKEINDEDSPRPR